MKYSRAKKLKRGDEVIFKKNNTVVRVSEIDVDEVHKQVYIFCEDDNCAYHQELVKKKRKRNMKYLIRIRRNRMSFNIGNTNSKFVVVSNVTMKFSVSEKILFADLRTSRKTGRFKTDEHGEAILDGNGQPVPEREYSHWEGHFVGEALEAAKALKDKAAINILEGWIEKDEFVGRDGKKRSKIYIVISAFEMCDEVKDDEEDSDELPY